MTTFTPVIIGYDGTGDSPYWYGFIILETSDDVDWKVLRTVSEDLKPVDVYIDQIDEEELADPDMDFDEYEFTMNKAARNRIEKLYAAAGLTVKVHRANSLLGALIPNRS